MTTKRLLTVALLSMITAVCSAQSKPTTAAPAPPEMTAVQIELQNRDLYVQRAALMEKLQADPLYRQLQVLDGDIQRGEQAARVMHYQEDQKARQAMREASAKAQQDQQQPQKPPLFAPK